MRVGISAEWISTRAGGLETYTANLVRALAELDGGHELRAYTTDPAALRDLAARHPRLSADYLGSRSRWFALSLGLPWQVLRRPVDVFHATVAPPPWCPAPLAFTVHDLAYVRRPEWYPPAIRRRLAWLTRLGVRRAAGLIAASEATKEDIVDVYGVEPARIAVVYQGVNPRYRPVADGPERRQVLERHGISGPYVLFVSRFHARKNLLRLLAAWDALRTGPVRGLKLVLCGRDQYHGALVMAEIERRGLGEEVVVPGYVPDEDLPHVYSAATAFVYPSLFEGFGHPPLEAMACGTPVIASRTTSMPEVLGEAAVLVDPHDEHAIAEGIAEVVGDEARRQALRESGQARVRRFTWEATARATMRVYERITGDSGAGRGG